MEWGQGKDGLDEFLEGSAYIINGKENKVHMDYFCFLSFYEKCLLMVNGRYITPKSCPQCWQ